MAGYVRNDTTNNIADGNIINASDLDGEFDAIVAAFVNTTGHTHDGTAAEGAPITKIGPTQDVVASATDLTPKTTNTLDLGSSSLKFKDIYAAGTAYVATLDLTNALSVADGGTGLTTVGTNGQVLTVVDGVPAWSDAATGLPDQTGNAGKFLTTDGSDASWAETGAAAGGAIYVNSTTVATNYTIASGKNGFSVGPITVASGYAVTVSSGQRWVVI